MLRWRSAFSTKPDWTISSSRITAYLKNGGTLEKAASTANDASTRTTQLYERRLDEMGLNEALRIAHNPWACRLFVCRGHRMFAKPKATAFFFVRSGRIRDRQAGREFTPKPFDPSCI
jgi:hypothetical protein